MNVTRDHETETPATYFQLFLSTFRLSLFTLGGGYVIVPLMRNLFVREYGWIDEEEMLDIIAISQSSPGPIAVNTSILVGYRMRGVRGALLTLLGTILPAMIILSLLSLVYEWVKDNSIIQDLLEGMRIGVSAVILHAVYVMARTITRKKELVSIIIMAVAFVLSYFLQVNILIVIAFGILSGLIHYFASVKRGQA